MIYHVIRMSIKPDVPTEEVEAALRRMREAGSEIVPARARIFGRDFGGTFDYGAVSVFQTLEEYEEMMNHPSHLDVDRLGLPLVDKFVSFDITDDSDPDMAAKIAAIHQRRFEAMPDIADLVSGIDEYSGSAAPARRDA